MEVSVIIPTFNAQKYLPKLLKALSQQTLAHELIIIDSSSTDETLKIAKEYTNSVITIPQKEFDHGGTRTLACDYAHGDLVIFLTQDVLPYNNESLERLVKMFEDPAIAAVYGRQIPYDSTSIFGKHLRLFNYPASSHIRKLEDRKKYGIKTAFLSDSFAGYRKNILDSVGRFKKGMIMGEDMEIGARLLHAGFRIGYASDAIVYHAHSYTMQQEFKRYFDIGVFHSREKWILDSFGKPEKEGNKFIHSEFNYLLEQKSYHLIPSFLLRNGLKYLGYKLGRKYRHLPLSLTKKMSMHGTWWETNHHKNR